MRPGDLDAQAGAVELIHLQYWAVCHDYIAKDAASVSSAATLGYHLAQPSEMPNHSKNRLTLLL
jgi:hypothetical protein